MRDRRTLGWGLVALGGLLVIVGVIGMITSGDDTAAAAATTSSSTTARPTTTAAPTTTTAPPTTTTTAPTTTAAAPTTTTAPPTTTTSAPTTTTAAPTTTTAPPDALIAAFASRLVETLGAGDTTFAFDTLHPVVISRFGADFCRAYVDREVSLITGYTLAGPVSGPTRQVFDTPDGDVGVDVFTAPVTFVFQGQTVETTGSFAIVDGVVFWFTACR